MPSRTFQDPGNNFALYGPVPSAVGHVGGIFAAAHATSQLTFQMPVTFPHQ